MRGEERKKQFLRRINISCSIECAYFYGSLNCVGRLVFVIGTDRMCVCVCVNLVIRSCPF